MGTEPAYRVLVDALSAAKPRTREAIMHSLCGVRDEKAVPLFAYLVRHVSRRGTGTALVVRAIEALGALREGSGTPLLRDVLYGGEWWAPRRRSTLRAAAAGALARIATADAVEILQQAAVRGPRGVRAAARVHIHAVGAAGTPMAQGHA